MTGFAHLLQHPKAGCVGPITTVRPRRPPPPEHSTPIQPHHHDLPTIDPTPNGDDSLRFIAFSLRRQRLHWGIKYNL